ncbi:hypothetical protein [Micropruina sonneratiae]|uniref:hypothetical protein n=1 Tax=Micropruina sonneratiae TaxID=2986940 RepID=UPI0022264342|nr:hypothetical protein [Micropruina sp. KQZ13P-5]MCW3156930.1 hypothetical protein [Micropruina sp. KQZ13P-5]
MKALILTMTSILLLGLPTATEPVADRPGQDTRTTTPSSFCWWFPYLPGCPRR